MKPLHLHEASTRAFNVTFRLVVSRTLMESRSVTRWGKERLLITAGCRITSKCSTRIEPNRRGVSVQLPAIIKFELIDSGIIGRMGEQKRAQDVYIERPQGKSRRSHGEEMGQTRYGIRGKKILDLLTRPFRRLLRRCKPNSCSADRLRTLGHARFRRYLNLITRRPWSPKRIEASNFETTQPTDSPSPTLLAAFENRSWLLQPFTEGATSALG